MIPKDMFSTDIREQTVIEFLKKQNMDFKIIEDLGDPFSSPIIEYKPYPKPELEKQILEVWINVVPGTFPKPVFRGLK